MTTPDSLIQEAATVEYVQNTQGQKVEKSREGSNDEDKFSECREGLIHQEEETVEHFQIIQEHKGSKREDNSSSSSDISCDVLEFTARLWGSEIQRDIVNETTSRRLDEIERKVNEIVTGMNDEEHDRKKDGDGKRVFEEMFIR